MIISSIFPGHLFTAGFETRSDSIYRSEITEIFSGSIFRVRQVHSPSVITISKEDSPQKVSTVKADGMVTSRRGALLTVWVADCVPILIADTQGSCAAAIHCGWKGLAGRIIAAAVKRMASGFGADPGSLLASIGPSIGPCCYEVGPDVARKLVESSGGAQVTLQREGKTMADLRETARRQLIQSSLKPSSIELVEMCTRCRGDLFYSRRRGNVKERTCGFIGIKP